jgi:ABC-type dipeptide/oligopeptide/nickel transport system permease component
MTPAAIIARLATILVTLFGVAVIVFVLVRVAPGDIITLMAGPGATEEDIANLRALYGLDRSIPVQFVIWLGQVLQGDFGASITLKQDVMTIVLRRLPATLELACLALIIAAAIGVIFALVAARFRGDLFNGVALAVPDFLWGLAFILLFGVLVPIFAISGRVSPELELPFVTNFYLVESIVRLRFDLTWNLLTHALMPAFAMALPLAAVIAQLLKTALKETMEKDYVTLARTRGFSETQVMLREALRNAAPGTLTLTGVQFTFLIGGTVIVERLFSYEGLGNLAIGAVKDRDLPLIQGIVLVFALLFILINLAVDLMQAALDPKLRHG